MFKSFCAANQLKIYLDCRTYCFGKSHSAILSKTIEIR